MEREGKSPEPAALEDQLERLHRESFGWALACCRFDREAAEEVLQIAYLKAIEGRARFNGHSTVRTWFFGVVRHTAFEWRRSSRARRIALARWVLGRSLAGAIPDPERSSADLETRERLRRSLLRLSTRQRELLQLVFYHELTVEDAAEVLGITTGSARTHYARGKDRLRSMLEGKEFR